MIDLIVFDLDGTLVDSHTDIANAANIVVQELGGARLSEEAIVRMVGEGAAVLMRRALIASGVKADLREALARFLEVYDGCLLDHTRPYPGTVELLEELAGRYRLALLTNKPARATIRVLDGLDLTRFFDPIIGGDTSFGRKPDPAGLLHIVLRRESSPSATLMVGDSPVDRETAGRAGTAICLARFGFGYTFQPVDLDGAEMIIDEPGDLLRILQTER